MTSRITEFELERFLLAELPNDDRDRVERLIAVDAQAAARLESLRRSSRDILESHDRVSMVRAIRARKQQVSPPRPWRGSPMKVGLLAAACLVVALAAPLILRRSVPGAGATPPEETLVKGAPSSLQIFRKTSTGSEPLHTGSLTSAGDLIRLGYQAVAARYGAIISIDGRGHLTRHWPRGGDMAESLKGPGLVLLDQAFELDDAPRFERFYLVTNVHAFQIGSVLSSIAATSRTEGAVPALPSTFEWAVVELRKERAQ